MPSHIEENLPPTNEGYGTKDYWCVILFWDESMG
jgi:hypothetical protein